MIILIISASHPVHQ